MTTKPAQGTPISQPRARESRQRRIPARSRRAWAVAASAAAVLAGPTATTTPAAAEPTSTHLAPTPSPAPPGLRLGERIEGKWIVSFDPATPPAHIRYARDAALRRGAAMRFDYIDAVRGFAGALDAGTVDALRKDPRVIAVEPDHRVYADGTQSPSPSWGLDRIDQAALPLSKSYTYGTAGAGVTAYVLDTGVRTTHTDFGGRASAGFSAFEDGKGAQDCNGHGTHVAGTIGGSTYGVAKSVKIVAVRVLDCDGSGTTSGLIAGVEWVTSHHRGPAVANLSLGGGVSAALDQAVTRSIASGVSYAVAAGNDNRDACGQSPARLSAAITVGASTTTDARASFSNYGPCVDLFAPGEAIRSAVHSSDSATALYSGTSMATPHVAGVIATYLQAHPSATAAQVHAALVQGSRLHKLVDIGPGSVNRLLSSVNPAPFAPGLAPAPTSTVPSARIPSGTHVRKSGVPVRVSWTSTAPGSAIKSHEFQRSRDGGKTWTTLGLPTPTTTQRSVDLAGGSWRFRVRPITTHGVIGAWSTGPVLTLRVKQQSAAIYQASTRWRKSAQSTALGGSVTRTKVRGAAATFRFTGTSVSWVGTVAPNGGKAQVFLDGKRLGIVDLYSRTTRPRQLILSKTVRAGTHVLRIRALGKHTPAARNSYVDADAFITLR